MHPNFEMPAAGRMWVFLPAEHPDRARCGVVPRAVPGVAGAPVCELRFPQMTWYDDVDLAAAVRQIDGLPTDPLVLIGFSKSGPGALRLALLRPERVAGLVLFDFPMPTLTPMLRLSLSNRGSSPAHGDDEMAGALKHRLTPGCRILLVSGPWFADEDAGFSCLLERHGVAHRFRARPDCPHRWDSGWLEEIAGK